MPATKTANWSPGGPCPRLSTAATSSPYPCNGSRSRPDWPWGVSRRSLWSRRCSSCPPGCRHRGRGRPPSPPAAAGRRGIRARRRGSLPRPSPRPHRPSPGLPRAPHPPFPLPPRSSSRWRTGVPGTSWPRRRGTLGFRKRPRRRTGRPPMAPGQSSSGGSSRSGRTTSPAPAPSSRRPSPSSRTRTGRWPGSLGLRSGKTDPRRRCGGSTRPSNGARGGSNITCSGATCWRPRGTRRRRSGSGARRCSSTRATGVSCPGSVPTPSAARVPRRQRTLRTNR